MHLNEFIESVKNWDWTAIFYNIVASFIFAGLAIWLGVVRYARKFYGRYWGMIAYRRRLQEVCSSLIVIGRKQGFSMNEVFVELDIATSSLSSTPQEDHQPWKSFVLLGGPGAGKSTMVRKLVLDRLEMRIMCIPFFVRLREYNGDEPIEQTLIRAVAAQRIADAEMFVSEKLKLDHTLCVLDGLDEVRPHLHKRVCEQINTFYHKYFHIDARAQLIVTCRKEAYRSHPLDIPQVCEVRPLSDQQIARFANNWPLKFPEGKSAQTFLRELNAAPRVLELARSPLLLVGGLMQYTESNLGIPEERVQYLERIARWLLSDWATAQGHPPDTFKPAYEKLLSKLAFFMQKHELNECPTEKVIELFRSWLPMFGFQANDAELLLENISTKTGILVRDVPGCAVFAQFGLQEFFASKGVLKELGANGLAETSLKPWWRETVVLSVAQEQDPSPALKALFNANPLMGAACVAECATPSLAMQQLAIDVCLKAIDSNDASGQAPTIALLRKLRDGNEVKICQELERRLSMDSGVQKRVGIIFASADTVNTSKILLRYPHIWDVCLADVGYLSNTFENLLVEWISRGTLDEALRAIDFVCKSLTSDREIELIELLPKLESRRSEKLASNLLKHFEDTDRRLFDVGEEALKRITACVQHIKDPNAYLATRKLQQSEPWRRMRSPIPAALVLASDDPKHISILWKRLRNAILWSRYRGALKLWMGSSILATSFFFVKQTGMTEPWQCLFSIGLILIALGFAIPFSAPPWMVRYSMPDTNITAAIAFLLGCSLILVLNPEHPAFPNALSPWLFLVFTTMSAAVGSTLTIKARHFVSDSEFLPPLKWICHSFGAGMALEAIAFANWPKIPFWIGAVVPGGFFVFFVIVSLLLFRDWRQIKKVAAKVENTLMGDS